MTAYLITTGIVFGLMTLVHLWRVWAEGPLLLREPLFIAFTFAAVGLCVWACALLWRRRRS